MSEVALAPLGEAHASAMARWMQDPAVRDNLGMRRDVTVASTVQWIRAAEADTSMMCFAILADGTHVGNVTIDRIDHDLKLARFSMYIGEASARGRGLGTDAARLAVHETFASSDLHKLWLIVHVANAAAIRAYLAAGFTIEGVHRDEFRLHDRLVSVFYMGTIRADAVSAKTS